MFDRSTKLISIMYQLFHPISIFFFRIAEYFKPSENLLDKIFEILADVRCSLLVAGANIADIIQFMDNKTELPTKTGQIAIVTGGARGIGTIVVKMLLECEMEVIVACRCPAAGDKFIRSLRESGTKSGTAKVYELDLSNQDSVRRFAERMKKDYEKIDVLINNAGIYYLKYGETVDGFETHWSVNYLSHFLLTSILSPLLNAAGRPGHCSRVINVSSCLHRAVTINFEDINNRKRFVGLDAYSQSKLAQVMFTKSIQEIFSNAGFHIEAYAADPGIVHTDIYHSWRWLKYVGWLMHFTGKNVRQGATPIVWAAVSDAVEGRGGIFIGNCRERSVNKEANVPDIRRRLFDLSLRQCKLEDFL